VLNVLAVVGFSIPMFVLGYGLAYVFASKLHWLPVQGFAPLSGGVVPFVRNLILPALSLSLIYLTLIANVTRASMQETLSQDYIRTAVAKGVGPTRILFGHALRNASIPIVTVVGAGLATLIGGVVITENVFAIPGLGRLTVDAILHRDYPVIQGVVLLSSTAYVLINLAVDLTYTVLDPRIRY
jgi:peptide/nickel transport system permease protein